MMFDHESAKLGAVQVTTQDFNCYDHFGVKVAHKVVKATFEVIEYNEQPADQIKADHALAAIDRPESKEQLVRLYGLTESDLAAARQLRNKYNRVLQWSTAAARAEEEGRPPPEKDPEVADFFGKLARS